MDKSMLQHGVFSWNELMTTDVEAAKNFYSKLFGWNMQDVPGCDTGYTMAKTGDIEVSGIMPIPATFPTMPATWGSYVTVDDVDNQTKLAEKLGGKIVLAPQDIPEVGRFAVISDPQGAILSLITYIKKE